MIIKCPTCSQGYDTTGYPDNYKFACSCGAIIDVAALQQQATGAASPSMAAEPYVHPPAPQPLPPEPWQGSAHPESTSNPTLNSSTDGLPPMQAVDFALDQAEATAVTRSPYTMQDMPYTSSGERGSPDAYASHSPDAYASHPPSHTTVPYESSAGMDSQPAQALGSQEVQQSYIPDSWTELDESPSHSANDIVLPIDDADRTEPRAIWALIFAFFVVLGPVVWFLAARARQQIRLAPNIFRGRRLALVGILIGLIQTLGLGGVIYLAWTQPNIHPLIHRTAFVLGMVQPRTTIDRFKKRAKDPAHLTLSLAQKLLNQRLRLRQKKAKSLPIAYLAHTSKPYYTHAYWRDPKRKTSRKGLYFRSARGHWHLAHVESVYQEETRVFETGPSKLTATLARQLIKKFWQLRGRFTGVTIKQLYVVQEAGSQVASAYWVLEKQKAGKPLQRWVIVSRFRRSSQGQWFLVRYAEHVPKEEQHQFSATSGPRLTVETARPLLAQAYKLFQKSFQPRSMAVTQEPNSTTGWLLWENGRRKPLLRSLFRYSTDQKWFFVRTLASPTLRKVYRIKGPTNLNSALAKTLLETYLRKQRDRLRVQHLYVYQRKGQHIAQVRWITKAPRQQKLGTPPPKPQQSVFHYTSDGSWNLTILHQRPAQEVLYHKKGGPRLSADIAKQLLRQYWRDQSWRSNSRRFSGAKIQALYTFQNSDNQRAWAHWIISNNDTKTPLRSSFYRSAEGHWYLGSYDLGKGYTLRYRITGPKQLSVKMLIPLLRNYVTLKYKDTRVVLRDFYVVQPTKQHRAYVRWVWESGSKARAVFSLLHRSNQGHWYLSIPELSNPPTL